MNLTLKGLIRKYQYGFPTHTDFEQVESALEEFCREKKLENKGTDASFHQHLAILYTPTDSESKSIRLKIPDHAYRGGIEWI
jgi:plasmid rolling circle replication initiator protein Rep